MIFQVASNYIPQRTVMERQTVPGVAWQPFDLLFDVADDKNSGCQARWPSGAVAIGRGVWSPSKQWPLGAA
jgi:hypothetical protein